MILIESLIIDGKEYRRAYSDKNVYLERDGILYSEAIDPADISREYIETEEVIVYEDEVTETDYQSALKEFGVNI